LEQQPASKRSIALPITMLLLVFSLIGNVFLYSQFLQHKQEKRLERGQNIYSYAIASIDYAERLSAQSTALAASHSLAERAQLKYEAGQAAGGGESMILLAEAAEELAASETAVTASGFESFIGKVDEQVRASGNDEGALSAEERQSLQELAQALDAISELLRNTFNEGIADNKAALIRLSTGLGWLENMPRLQQLVEEASAK
jgi:hypothetical protein